MIVSATSIKTHFERFSVTSQEVWPGTRKDGSGVEPGLLNFAAKLCHFITVITEGKKTFAAD